MKTGIEERVTALIENSAQRSDKHAQNMSRIASMLAEFDDIMERHLAQAGVDTTSEFALVSAHVATAVAPGEADAFTLPACDCIAPREIEMVNQLLTRNARLETYLDTLLAPKITSPVGP